MSQNNNNNTVISSWDYNYIDFDTLLNDVASSDFNWVDQCAVPELDAPLSSGAALEVKECAEKECPRKRGRSESCGSIGNKACREKQRREKLNERFLELSSTLEPGRPAASDKLAILGDTIRVLYQLSTEIQETKESKVKLEEEIKTLKAEKNELRKEKLALKADKTLMEQQLKTMTALPAGFLPVHPGAAYQAVPTNMPAHPGVTYPAVPSNMPAHPGTVYPTVPNNMPVYPSYSVFPMWHYLPQSVRDTSHDHELRPPAA
ncbi:Transcription factor bHLH104 like [Heracleum sosnowskyi]|uniref:Transcription factor bHLH104 like n=1 Tax=Heracleum sosnowskyi TaxID=360622 RepID=A0AAD8IR79_9APIA|nr:Transcription factor bHLH104 like [Heracleum sosnowskyi]